MAIITLTSNWGLKDHYLASVKGAILSRLPQAAIVDITHEIESFSIDKAGFILRNAYPYFPPGSIHLIGLNSIESDAHPHVVVKADGHYFISADNGIFTVLFDTPPEDYIYLEIPQESQYFTFPERDRFVKAACHLAEGKSMDELGTRPQANQSFIYTISKATLTENGLRGSIVYIDHYGNVYINISEKQFRETFGYNKFILKMPRERHNIYQLAKAYDDVRHGEVCALFASNGMLQVAVNEGNAEELLGLKLYSSVDVVFATDF